MADQTIIVVNWGDTGGSYKFQNDSNSEYGSEFEELPTEWDNKKAILLLSSYIPGP